MIPPADSLLDRVFPPAQCDDDLGDAMVASFTARARRWPEHAPVDDFFPRSDP